MISPILGIKVHIILYFATQLPTPNFSAPRDVMAKPAEVTLRLRFCGFCHKYGLILDKSYLGSRKKKLSGEKS
jgi:hypothetical protein